MRRLPPLNALPAFEATARLGSMKAAAGELGRTHSAISKQVAHLEEAMGVALFEPDGVGVRATAEGAAYALAVGEALDALVGAGERLRRAAREPSVVVRCSAGLAARWLIPRLPGFLQRHPDIDVRLTVAQGGGLIGGERLDDDLVLSWDRLTAPIGDLLDAVGPGATAHPIGDAAFGPVAAPGVAPEVDGDGAATLALIDHAGAPDLWPGWSALTGRVVRASSRVAYPSTLLCIEAAAAGLGACVVERRLVARELESGALTAPYGFAPWPRGLIAIRRGPGRPADAAFLAWLAEEGARD